MNKIKKQVYDCFIDKKYPYSIILIMADTKIDLEQLQNNERFHNWIEDFNWLSRDHKLRLYIIPKVNKTNRFIYEVLKTNLQFLKYDNNGTPTTIIKRIKLDYTIKDPVRRYKDFIVNISDIITNAYIIYRKEWTIFNKLISAHLNYASPSSIILQRY